ncbi:MAG: homoserine kinase [Fusobacteriota bacterium]
MAVYTKLKKNEIEKIIKDYDLGKLEEYIGIKKGIMNTNYLIKTNKDKYILRILEGDVDETYERKELEYLSFLNQNGIPCPNVLNDLFGRNHFYIKDKMAAVFSFLEGSEATDIDENLLYEFGKLLAKMHILSEDKILKRTEKIEMNYLYNIIIKDKNKLKNILNENYGPIMEKVKEVKKLEDLDLPNGIIHNDIFPDNIFVDENNNISGIIDFNDAMTENFIHDIAIVFNFWIFSKYGEYKKECVDSFLKGYEKIRKLKEIERKTFHLSLDRAALTFLFLRIEKFHYNSENSDMEFKDYRDLLPVVFAKKLYF